MMNDLNELNGKVKLNQFGEILLALPLGAISLDTEQALTALVL